MSFARCANDSDGDCSPVGFHLLLQLCILCLGNAQLLCQAGAALLKPAVILPALQLFLELLPHTPGLTLTGAMAELSSYIQQDNIAAYGRVQLTARVA